MKNEKLIERDILLSRSPDFTTLDFYLWGTVKIIVYRLNVNLQQKLIKRIIIVHLLN